MSDYATTPETYAAWRFLELNDELRPYDGERVDILRRNEELDLLLADLEKNPTIDNIERFFQRGLELRCLAQRSLSRSLEHYRCQNICIAELEARPEAYPDFGTVEEIRQHVAAIRRNDGHLAQLTTKIEEGQRSHVENETMLANLNDFIARRHAQEQDDESQLDIGGA